MYEERCLKGWGCYDEADADADALMLKLKLKLKSQNVARKWQTCATPDFALLLCFVLELVLCCDWKMPSNLPLKFPQTKYLLNT